MKTWRSCELLPEAPVTRRRVQVDPVTCGLLTQGQDQRSKVHWEEKPRPNDSDFTSC